MTRIAGKVKEILLCMLFFLFLLMMTYACASMGAPDGGEYDIDPPVFVSSKPNPNSVNFTGNKIELIFDEYVALDKPNEKVIITPPQMKQPIIKAIGKKISVELKDSLIPNTTYTFDFTNSIIDNNEKNALEGFTFAFSTGEVIDSLQISGMVFDAENMEPMKGILVGLHANLEDSAFTNIPFLRTSVTNDRGQFWIRNIAPGTYRLFALEDMNRNYMYDYPTELMAFHDSLIVPSFVPDVRMDTTWVDTLTIDTIQEIHYNRFIPDDIVLYLSKDKFEQQYIGRPERLDDKRFVLRFATKEFLPPSVFLIEDSVPENSKEEWYVLEYSEDGKELTYWITDSLVHKRDTLRMEVDYTAHDSIFQPTAYTDTVQLILRNRPKPEKDKKKKEGEEVPPTFLSIQGSSAGTIEIYDTLKFTFSEPLKEFDLSKVIFEQKVDTIWEARDFAVKTDLYNPRIYYLDYPWKYGEEFLVTFDSATVFSIYDLWNDSTSIRFKIRDEEEYGDLYINLSGNTTSGFGELLDQSGKIIRKSFLYNGSLIFENLKPFKYYLRYIEDVNANGLWDPGDYKENIQPEEVYYYEGFFEIRKYAQIEQNWNIKDIPRIKQKPLEITKNKPEEKKQPNRNEERKKQQKQQNQQNRNQQRNNMNSGSLNSRTTNTPQQYTR